MKKRNKYKKRRRLLLIVIFTIVIIIFSAKNIFSKNDKNSEKDITTSVSTSKIQEYINSNLYNKFNPSIEDWNLILVNKENYVPGNYSTEVEEIENGFEVDKRIKDSLSEMLKDARKEGLEPWICSSYRSSDKQKRLFNNKVNLYKNQGYSEKRAEEEASRWVAIPGTSEHEIGLSLDIVSKNYQLLDKKQESTPEQKWLMEHCHEYGFVMRYPTEKKDITKINYEPWHYRYVGIENAKIMKEKNFCLEEYIEYLKDKK